MTRTKLMILWGLLMSVWLSKTLFADSTETIEITTATEATSEETFTETTTEEVRNILPKKIEDYVAGVVAAEMPVYFPTEALKAQAVAARTYAFREYLNNKNVDLPSIGQAYMSESELKQRWGSDFEANYSKILKAVTDTKGEIMLYDDEPILAVFCSASGGMTENSENVWGRALPYLVSVSSDGDKQAPVYRETIYFKKDRLAELLGVADADDIHITKRSKAGYVLEIEAGGKKFEGVDFGSILRLRSSDLEISVDGENIAITTYGFGHGVGMSQYGAAYMAENGCGYDEILKHYYTDIRLERFTVE